jgi:hypothetical protein
VSETQLAWYSPLFYRDAHPIAIGRVGFTEHEGRRILLVDFSRADLEIVRAVAAECLHLMTQEPTDSVLSLVPVEETNFSSDILKVAKELTDRVRPYGRRSALSGVTGLRSFVLQTFADAGRRPLKFFKDRPAALAWLVSDDSE